MPGESVSTANYAAVIADLRAKRDELDRTIALLEAMNGLSVGDSTGGGSFERQEPKPRAAAPDLAALSQGDACVWLLRKISRPMKTREIADGLAESGFKTNSADPVNNVSAALHHRAKTKGDVTREGKFWRLVGEKSPHEATPSLNGAEHHASAT